MSARVKKFLKVGVISFLAPAMCASAFAAPQWCSTSVANLWINSGGDVFVHLAIRGDYVRVCNVKTTLQVGSKSIETTTCLSWLSMLRIGVSQAKPMTLYYDDAPACTQLPSYTGAPLPEYVMLN